MLKFKKSLTISGLIVICISGCQQLAVPDFKKNRTTFVVPVEVVDKTKFGLQSKFSITIKSNSSNKKYTYLITPSLNIMYKLITDLPPGKYTLEKFDTITWDQKKYPKNINDSSIVLEQSKITIYNKTLYYEQKQKGGSNWYT